MSSYDRPVPSPDDVVRRAAVDAHGAAVEAARAARSEFLAELRAEFVEIDHAVGGQGSAIRAIDREIAALAATAK